MQGQSAGNCAAVLFPDFEKFQFIVFGVIGRNKRAFVPIFCGILEVCRAVTLEVDAISVRNHGIDPVRFNAGIVSAKRVIAKSLQISGFTVEKAYFHAAVDVNPAVTFHCCLRAVNGCAEIRLPVFAENRRRGFAVFFAQFGRFFFERIGGFRFGFGFTVRRRIVIRLDFAVCRRLFSRCAGRKQQNCREH